MGECGPKVQTFMYEVNKSWDVMDNMVIMANNSLLYASESLRD